MTYTNQGSMMVKMANQLLFCEVDELLPQFSADLQWKSSTQDLTSPRILHHHKLELAALVHWFIMSRVPPHLSPVLHSRQRISSVSHLHVTLYISFAVFNSYEASDKKIRQFRPQLQACMDNLG